MKHNNIYIMGLSEKEESEQGIKNPFKYVITKNYPNLVKEKETQVQEAQSPKQDGHKEAHTK